MSPRTRRGRVLGLAVAALAVIGRGWAADGVVQVDLDMALNKSAYLVGEPVLARTVIGNASAEEGASALDAALTTSPRGNGLTFWVEKDGTGYWQLPDKRTPLRVIKRTDFDRSPPEEPQRLPYEYFVPGKCIERVDMLAFGEPGRYGLKAVVQVQPGGWFESARIECTVEAVGERDGITKVVPAEDLYTLARDLYAAHYGYGKEHEWQTGGGPVGVVQRVHEVCPGSVFAEYVDYAATVAAMRPALQIYLPDPEQLVAAFQRFKEAYPDSWLLPHVAGAAIAARPELALDEAAAPEILALYRASEPEYACSVAVRQKVEWEMAKQR